MNMNITRHTIAGLALAAALVSCRKTDGYLFDNVVYLNVAETKAEQSATVGKTIPEKEYTLYASLAYPSETDVDVSVEVVPDLVDTYNALHGTSYPMLDSEYFEFKGGEFVIPAGKIVSGISTLSLKNLMGEGENQEGALPEDETYLVPVSITSSSVSTLEESATAYYLVKRSSNITIAAQLGEGNWINFPTLDKYSDNSNAFNGLTAVTYEAFIYIDTFIDSMKKADDDETISVSISSIMGKEQYLLLRIGDTSIERRQLQFVGEAAGASFGKMPKSDARKNLEAGRWYHVAATFDQKTQMALIYVDGVLQSQTKGSVIMEGKTIDLAERAFYDMWMQMPEDEKKANESQYGGLDEAYQFFIGKSYDDYRPLNGKIAEVRVWSVARTQQEIYDNMYEIKEPESIPELIGYWKFNDGQGNVIKDYSRYHNDGVAEKDLTWPSGIEIPKTH